MSDYLDSVEKQLSRLTERGVPRRSLARTTIVRAPRPGRNLLEASPTDGDQGPRRRREALVLIPVVLAVIAVAVVISGIGMGVHHRPAAARRTTTVPHNRHGFRPPSGSHHRAAAPAKPGGSRANIHIAAPAGPVPAGFYPTSFTAIGSDTWWLLGGAPCSSPPCISIVRTDNGGRSFVGTPAPRTSAVSQLRFADPADGYAYGPSLWTTHDGGATWHPYKVIGQVSEVTIAGGYAYAILRSKGGATGLLLRTPVGRDAWAPLRHAGRVTSGLWAQGAEVLVGAAGAANGRPVLEVSQDSGSTFVSRPVPPAVVCDFQAPSPPVVWAHCATGTESRTWRSAADGASFVSADGNAPSLPNSAAFGAATGGSAVVGFRQLYRTADAGGHWSAVPGTSGVAEWLYIGFTNPRHGVALGDVGSGAPANERAFITTDGGASYHQVTIH